MTATTYETIIGLEVHAQLLTRSKMFCSCSADYADAPPNTHVCPVCLALPGVLPVINRRAIEYAIMTALALNCTIPGFTKFDRKNYPYPDLMKGYQISQYDSPIGINGWLMVETEGVQRRIGITRVHMEEDVAKLIHRSTSWGQPCSLVDVNRSGVPLMEIVSEPDIRSAQEARQYLMKLRGILQYLGVSTGNMEEGSFRCDANISIRPEGAVETLAKVEVKNMNSFKAVFRALEYEAERQRQVAAEGGALTQETRGWVEEQGVTVSQRSKEYAHDYRYFPEPDLPPLNLGRSWIEEIEARLPELPDVKRERFLEQYGIPLYDANLLTGSRAVADYFESCLQVQGRGTPESRAKTVTNWILGDFARLLNANDMEINESRVAPASLVELLDLVDEGQLSGPAAKKVFEEMFQTGRGAREIATEKGLTQMSDSSAVVEIVRQVLADNPQAVADFKAGKEQAVKFLVGQVMRASRGRANPQMVTEAIKEELGAE